MTSRTSTLRLRCPRCWLGPQPALDGGPCRLCGGSGYVDQDVCLAGPPDPPADVRHRGEVIERPMRPAGEAVS